MPTTSCKRLLVPMSAAIGRPVSIDEALRVESLVLSFYVNPLVKYVVKEHSRGGKCDFMRLYLAMKNGIIRGAKKPVQVAFRGRFVEIYRIFDKAFDMNLQDGDMTHIWRMSQEFNTAEILVALRYSMDRGIKSAAYVYKVAKARKERAERRPVRSCQTLAPSMPTCKIGDVDGAINAWEDTREAARTYGANFDGNRAGRIDPTHQGDDKTL